MEKLLIVRMAIQNLDEFNQMTETAKLNVWIRTQWVDQSLGWMVIYLH